MATSTYLLGNAGKTLPLIGVIMLAVMLIGGIVAVINSITYSIETTFSYAREFVAVSPRGDPSLLPGLKNEIIRDAPVPIERTITVHVAGSHVNSVVSQLQFAVLGLTPDDLKFWLDRLNTQSIEGRVPKAGEPEAIISEPVSRNLRLKVGDFLLKPDTADSYAPVPVKIVGIAHTDRWTMAADYQFISENFPPPIDNLLFFAKTATDQQKLDNWAAKHFLGRRERVLTYREINRQNRSMFRSLFKILNVVIGTLVIVLTIMMGMLINIYQTQRIVEFGLLQALGYTKRQLLNRVLKEVASMVVIGWLLGLALGFLLLLGVKKVIMDPNAYGVVLDDPVAFRYTLPVPLSIMLAGILTIYLRFRRFDPVSIVERRLV